VSAPKKAQSRNHTRKAAYAAQADKSSRNEVALERQKLVHDEVKKPVVSVAPLTETHAEFDDASPVMPKTKAVAPPKPDYAPPKPDYAPPLPTISKSVKNKGRARQLRTWQRCALSTHGHDFSGVRHNPERKYRTDRCITCGCPSNEVGVQS
jgi:hypothetical protein